MRFIKFAVPFMLAMFIVSAQGAEKPANKGMHGELAAAPAGAAAGVVGVLTVKHHAKNGEAAPAPMMYNLVADGDIAKQVTALIGKNVDITGTGTEASYKVETIAEHVKKPK